MRSYGKRKWSVTPLALLFFVGMLVSDRSGIFLATVIAAGVHEMGHLLAARWMKIPLSAVRIDLLGARIAVSHRLISYGKEWLLCAAGPLFSLLLSAAAVPLWLCFDFFYVLSCTSLLLGFLNLLPVASFDGGRMAEVTLTCFLGQNAACRIMNTVTVSALFLLWLLSVYFLLRSSGGFSVFCFSLGLLARFLECGKIG